MNRLTVVDGFRGFFLLFMGVHHFNSVLATTLGKLNHHNLGWVEDAQGFVFISGLMVGIVYGRKFLRAPSHRAGDGPVLARVRTIYLHQAGLVLLLAAAALALGPLASKPLATFLEAPVAFTLANLGLVTAAPHMGILPMYIVFLLATPLAFRMLARGWNAPFFLVLLLCWTAGQTRLPELGADAVQAALGLPFRFALGFDLLAWQLLFFTGLWFGYRAAAGQLDLAFLREEQYRVAFLLAVFGIAMLAAFDRVVGGDLLGVTYSEALTDRTDRGLLAWIYPIAFLIDLFVVVWLLRVGVTDRNPWIRRLGAALAWMFSRRPLVFLGQHSLHVFSFHILVYYLLAQAVPPLGLSEAMRSAILVLAVASLFLAAGFHAALQARDARKAGGAPAAAG